MNSLFFLPVQFGNEFEIRSLKPVSKNTKPTEQDEIIKYSNGQAEDEVRKIVECYIAEQNCELPADCGVPDLPPIVSKQTFKAIQTALKAMLWLPCKLAFTVQSILAPALPVVFNL